MVSNIRSTLLTKIEEIKESITTLQRCVSIKYVAQDWHGVSDTANDIRELNAEWKAYSTILEKIDELENEPGKGKDEKTNKSCDLCRDVIGIGKQCQCG